MTRRIIIFLRRSNSEFNSQLRRLKKRIAEIAKRRRMWDAGHSVSGSGSESLRAAYSVRAAIATTSVTVDAPTEKAGYKTCVPLQRRPRSTIIEEEGVKPWAYLSCPLVKQPRMPYECVSRYPLLLFLRLRILFSVTLTTSVFPTLLPSLVRVSTECLLNQEEYAWERQPARNYATLILTVVTTLSTYIYKLKRVIGMAWWKGWERMFQIQDPLSPKPM